MDVQHLYVKTVEVNSFSSLLFLLNREKKKKTEKQVQLFSMFCRLWSVSLYRKNVLRDGRKLNLRETTSCPPRLRQGAGEHCAPYVRQAPVRHYAKIR